ncbi:MAG: glycosyltransferase [Roseicyclus sp.]
MTSGPGPATGGIRSAVPALRILIGSAHPYLPQIRGGAQSSSHELALALRERGHEVAVLGGLTGRGRIGAVSRLRLKLGRRTYVRDAWPGYPVFRAWFAKDAAAEVAGDFRPDVAFLQSGRPMELAEAFSAAGVASVVYLRNVEEDDLGGPVVAERSRFVANSRFTAERFAARHGIRSEVVHPLVRPDRYRTGTNRRNVTFINPHPHKGVDVAVALARRCPEIPFVFVRAWTLSKADERALSEAIATLPNVTLRPSVDDMRKIYREARLVLAPSRWNEAFGRIAAEAHVNGIPVLASDRGGLTEAVGPGGIVLDPDGPIDAWVAALRTLWQDEAAYARKAEAALAHSRRRAMDPDRQIAALERILASGARQGAGSGRIAR